MPTPRQTKTYQFDLFSNSNDARIAQTPRWQALPTETRRTVTKLMVRMILDHVHVARAPEREERRYDV